MRSQQLALGETFDSRKIKRFFGGAYLKKSHAKTARPISVRRPMHLVVRSTRATGSQSFLLRDRDLRKVLSKQGKSFGVKIYRFANAGNHLHMIVLPRSRAAFQKFLRSVTGIIARKILGAERGSARGLQFWDQRPFTRIVEWGRDFTRVNRYLLQNALEAIGFIPYRPRGKSKLVAIAPS